MITPSGPAQSQGVLTISDQRTAVLVGHAPGVMYNR
jgi:hypothetical protein